VTCVGDSECIELRPHGEKNAENGNGKAFSPQRTRTTATAKAVFTAENAKNAENYKLQRLFSKSSCSSQFSAFFALSAVKKQLPLLLYKPPTAIPRSKFSAFSAPPR
jgi:hypothetical protein